jgi:hypothetical protein
VTDYLVYKESGELKLQLHSQYAEEDLLKKDFEPGRNLVAISNVVGVTDEQFEEAARRQAEMYFRGEYQDPKSIDCWAAGALERQRCLKANTPSNRL